MDAPWLHRVGVYKKHSLIFIGRRDIYVSTMCPNLYSYYEYIKSILKKLIKQFDFVFKRLFPGVTCERRVSSGTHAPLSILDLILISAPYPHHRFPVLCKHEPLTGGCSAGRTLLSMLRTSRLHASHSVPFPL